MALSGYSWRMPFNLAQSLAASVAGHPVAVRPGDMTGKAAYADLRDVRFTTPADVEVPYCIESADITAPVFHVRYDLAAGASGTAQGILYTGNAAASDAQNAAATFAGYIARCGLSEASGNFTDSVGGYTGVASNIEAYAQVGQVGPCARFNGTNSNAACGDITQLDMAGSFTASLWAAQDVLTASDVLWIKHTNPSLRIALRTSGGAMYFDLGNGASTNGYLDHTAFMSAGVMAHIAAVFDGSGVANADRMKLYINGVSRALSYTGTIPATTSDMFGYPWYLSYTSSAFDGLLDEMRLHASARTASDILAEYHSGADTLLTYGAWEALGGGIIRRHRIEQVRLGPRLLAIGRRS